MPALLLRSDCLRLALVVLAEHCFDAVLDLDRAHRATGGGEAAITSGGGRGEGVHVTCFLSSAPASAAWWSKGASARRTVRSGARRVLQRRALTRRWRRRRGRIPSRRRRAQLRLPPRQRRCIRSDEACDGVAAPRQRAATSCADRPGAPWCGSCVGVPRCSS